MEYEHLLFLFAPYSFIFSSKLSDGYMSRQNNTFSTYKPTRTTFNGKIMEYEHLFFALPLSEWKNRVKFSKSSNILQLLSPYTCSKFLNSFRYLNFSPELSDGYIYNHRYMSPRLIWPEFARSTILFPT